MPNVNNPSNGPARILNIVYVNWKKIDNIMQIFLGLLIQQERSNMKYPGST